MRLGDKRRNKNSGPLPQSVARGRPPGCRIIEPPYDALGIDRSAGLDRQDPVRKDRIAEPAARLQLTF